MLPYRYRYVDLRLIEKGATPDYAFLKKGGPQGFRATQSRGVVYFSWVDLSVCEVPDARGWLGLVFSTQAYADTFTPPLPVGVQDHTGFEIARARPVRGPQY